ncbi:NmrA family NAD(P)-binding protein [Ensifer canadensis]|uniref:NmrA family NAD(P)-binding protein n=1 Tax=Ensifer canadensis TaxID=555315 RepID=UPI0035E3BE37
MVISRKLAVVVTGATGQQGGAVAKNLLERGHEVRAVTRNTDSAKARKLANAGATLFRASLEATATLTKALEGATSLFVMTTPFEGGPQAETRQGNSAADASKAAGVHLVFNSVGSANRQTGVPHFDSKYEVEKHIAEIGVRATVLTAYTSLRAVLAEHTTFDPKVGAALTLAAAAGVGNAYMTRLAQMNGWTEEQVGALKTGTSTNDVKIDVLAGLAREAAANSGNVADVTWKAAQFAGWSDEQLADVFAYVGATVFTGYFLNYAQTDLDV